VEKIRGLKTGRADKSGAKAQAERR
jgi:hypothetical protein